MNIALIMHELLVEGGGERQCVSLARALARQGHEVVVYTSAYDPSNCFPEICRDIAIIETGRGRWPRLRKPAFLRGYLDMRHLARHFQAPPALAGCHGSRESSGAAGDEGSAAAGRFGPELSRVFRFAPGTRGQAEPPGAGDFCRKSGGR